MVFWQSALPTRATMPVTNMAKQKIRCIQIILYFWLNQVKNTAVLATTMTQPNIARYVIAINPNLLSLVHEQYNCKYAFAISSVVKENINEKQVTAAEMATILKMKQIRARITIRTVITLFLQTFFFYYGDNYAYYCFGQLFICEPTISDPYYFINRQLINIMGDPIQLQYRQMLIITSLVLQQIEIIIIQISINKMICNDIKKMSLSYAKCPSGDLHTGEILSLVCVDSKCHKRGLICPICRMMNHQDHQVLPLKIFIDQVRKLFLQSEDSQSLNNLSDYLRSIDQSKKQLLSLLRQTAQGIAKQLKKIQQKIQQNYIAIKKNIFAQSTMSTKLPLFIQNLLKKQENDPYYLQQQFQKYTQLIKFNKSQIQVSDKAKKIVEDYSQTPKQIQIILKEQTQKLRTAFKDLFSQKSSKAKKVQGYTFSTQHKYKQLNISDDKKEIYTQSTLEQYGLGYINQGVGTLDRKITFRIQKMTSPNIIIGVGFPKKDQQQAYLYSMPIQNCHFVINSDGYCQNQNYDEDMSEEAPTSFIFNFTGAEVNISLQGSKSQIIFSKGDETKVFSTNKLSEQQKKQLQFFVSLGENDRVKIVQNK